MALGHHHNHHHEQGVATSKDLHHPGRKGALAGFVALAMNALTVASSWGMAAMGGLGIFYSAFEYNNNNQCNVKDFITPMMYLIVASSVEIALAGLTILPAVMDAVQGAKIARNHLHVPSTGIATASLALQAVNFLLLIFLGVWAGFGGWSFWHSNQGCGPRDLYLFLWAFLIVEMALVAFRLLTTASAGIAALTQLLTGKRAERREAAIEGEKVPEYNNYNGAGQQYGAHNNQYLDETRPVSPAPVANTNYAANTIEAPVSGYNQHHTILVDPATRQY